MKECAAKRAAIEREQERRERDPRDRRMSVAGETERQQET